MHYNITREDYVEIVVTREMKRVAEKRSAELQNLRGSITKGEGSLAGCICEEACKIVIPELEEDYCKDHDFIYHEATFDSKALRCAFKPPLRYEMSVSTWARHQECDYYVFSRILEDYSRLWIVGFMEREEFYDKGFYTGEGDMRDDGFKYKANNDNIYIKNISYKPFTKEKLDEVLGLSGKENLGVWFEL